MVAGGGTIFVNAIPAVEKLYAETMEGDEKTGVQIVPRLWTLPSVRSLPTPAWMAL